MSRLATITAFAMSALIIGADPARAILINWNNAAGGSSATLANWNPAQFPAPADIIRFNLPNTYGVTFGSTVDSVSSHQVYDGDVTYNITGDHGITTGFHVAPLAGQSAIARLLSGTARLGWSISVGAGAGATGTLRIAGGSTNVSQNILGAPPSGPVMNIGGTIAGAGTGEVIVLNGGQADLAGAINIGRSAGGTGTLRVQGSGAGVSGLRRSHLFADNTTSDARIGMEGGHGILEVLDGGNFRIGRDLFVAEESGEEGEITIGGENVLDSSAVRVKDDLRVAVNDAAGTAAGIGTITLDSLGVLVVDDSTVVGDPDGSTGLITLTAHTRMITRHLILQQPSGDAIDFQGGLLQVDGGTFSTNTNRLSLPGGTSNLSSEIPTLELLNSATASFVGTGAQPALMVGTIGHQFVRVKSGSQITANGGSVALGDQAGGNGRIFLSEGGELHSDRFATVGLNGNGVLHVNSGAHADLGGLNLGAAATGNGDIRVENPGSVLISSGAVNLGGSILAAAGTGELGIYDGAIASFTAPLNAGTVWPGGELIVSDGGRAELTGILTVRGQLDMGDGLVTGGSIALRGSGQITGQGVVQSGILAAVDSTVIIAPTGDLEIGRDDTGGDVLMHGTMDINGHSLTVHDPNSAVLGNVEIVGGQLHLPPGGGVMEAGKRLVGDGTITGPLVNNGKLISNGVNGLRFAGTVFGFGQGIGGDQFVFLGGGGFEGSGGIDAKLQADPGSLIRATSSLVLGKVVADALVLQGRLECGSGTVILRNASQTMIEGELVLQGGVVMMNGAPFSPMVQTDGRIQGTGVIAPGLVVAGTAAPGNSAGLLQVSGDVTFAPGTFEVELGDHAAGEWDVLQASGMAVVAGTLDLRRLASFAAAPGDSFEILRCDSLIGTFSTVTLDGDPLAGEFEVHYGSNRIWVVVPSSTVGVDDRTPVSAPVLALQLAPVASPGRNAGVELALPSAAAVDLRVYDVNGRQVGALWNGGLGAGRHRFELSRVPGAGVFFVRAAVSDGSERSVMKARVVRLR